MLADDIARSFLVVFYNIKESRKEERARDSNL